MRKIDIINSVKLNNIFTAIIIIFVCSIYFFLAPNSTKPNFFIPQKTLNIYPFTGNFYNWQTYNLTKFKTDLSVDAQYVKYLTELDGTKLLEYGNTDNKIKMFFDTSIYKNKVYLYFGITPILLFYMPFYLATNYFLSDHIVVLILSISIFLLQILIYKKITELLNKKEFFNPILLLPLGLSSGVILTYVSITIHLIPILTSILFSLLSVYVYLLLDNERNLNLKMFLIGLFLALSVGARPNNIMFLFLMFFIVVLINNKFDIKKYWKQYLCFLLPCVLFGSLVAVYNYIRFDSIFDFGFKYQFSPVYMQDISKPFTLVCQYVLQNLFFLPKFISNDPFVVFAYSSSSHFEPVVGGLILCPFCLSLLYIVKFYKIQNNKLINNFFILSLVMSFIYLCFASCKGFNARFVAEIIYLLIVPAIILFYSFIEQIKNKKLYNVIMILFYGVVVFSLYINTNLINCIFLMSKNGII